MDELFVTDSEKLEAIAVLRAGIPTPFWNLVKRIIDNNIEIAKIQLEDGVDEKGNEIDIDLVRLKIKVFRDVRNTPENVISQLETVEQTIEPDDPYDGSAEESVSEVDNGEQKT